MDTVMNYVIVLLEGIISFFSPCILPILPIYLGMLSSSSVTELKEGKTKFIKSGLFVNSLCFAFGISTTFFLLGSVITSLSSIFYDYKHLITIIGGILIVIMGLFYSGVISINMMNQEKRFQTKIVNMNFFTAYLLGFSFSFGWTPCIGPMLSSVLLMASGVETKLQGILLIGIYTMGFLVPFLVVALFYSRLITVLDQIKRNMKWIKIAGGVILIGAGLMMTVSGVREYSKQMKSYHNSQETIAPVETDQKKAEKNNESQMDFTLFDQFGMKHTLSEYKGKQVFLNFWATWCPPCRGELPEIQKLYDRYHKENGDVIVLTIVSPSFYSEGSKEEIIAFLEERQLTFPVLFDEKGSLLDRFRISAFPTTILINPDGTTKLVVPGAMNFQMMEELITKES